MLSSLANVRHYQPKLKEAIANAGSMKLSCMTQKSQIYGGVVLFRSFTILLRWQCCSPPNFGTGEHEANDEKFLRGSLQQKYRVSLRNSTSAYLAQTGPAVKQPAVARSSLTKHIGDRHEAFGKKSSSTAPTRQPGQTCILH